MLDTTVAEAIRSLEAQGRRIVRVHLGGNDTIVALEALRREIVEAIAR